MDGKRFGVGLAAGLMVGLAIITVSGGIGSSFGLYDSLGSQNGANLASSTTTEAAGLTTSTASTSSSTSGAPAYVVTPGSNSTLTSTVSSNTYTTDQKAAHGAASGFSANPFVFSSNIASIAQRPATSNAVVFIPVLVAFFLGAIVYRASNRSKEETDEDQS